MGSAFSYYVQWSVQICFREKKDECNYKVSTNLCGALPLGGTPERPRLVKHRESARSARLLGSAQLSSKVLSRSG